VIALAGMRRRLHLAQQRVHLVGLHAPTGPDRSVAGHARQNRVCARPHTADRTGVAQFIGHVAHQGGGVHRAERRGRLANGNAAGAERLHRQTEPGQIGGMFEDAGGVVTKLHDLGNEQRLRRHALRVRRARGPPRRPGVGGAVGGGLFDAAGPDEPGARPGREREDAGGSGARRGGRPRRAPAAAEPAAQVFAAYAQVAPPLPVEGLFTYGVPEALSARVVPGVRARVPFGPRTLSAMVVSVGARAPEGVAVRALTGLVEDEPLAGVFLTHLHLDHVLGVPDVPAGTPLYVGPGEADGSRFLHAFTQGTTDRALEGHDALRELPFEPDPDGRFAGVLDVFGDGSLFAILSPGHTTGMTAFVLRTTDGPVLLTGDVSHTAWGFTHGVGPGDYTQDHEPGEESLAALRALADRHPTMRVQPGHQPAIGAE